MKKNFKMAVISLSFLIIGSMLMACGTKKVEEKTSAEVSTEDDWHDITISGYTFNIPDELIFTDSDDNGIGFIKNGNFDDAMLTINVQSYNDEYSNVNKDVLKATLELWGENCEEKEFEYYEESNYKGCYSWIDAKIGKDVCNNLTCIYVDRTNIIMITYIMDEKTDKEIKIENELLKQIGNKFVKLNY